MPAASTSRSRGYSRDKYGVIDIDTFRFRYSNEPYILATQAEPVFFVNLLNKPGWSSVVAVRPRNSFAMLETENEGGMEVDLLDVGIQDMNLLGPNEDLSNWTRPNKDGTTSDASVINRCVAKQFLNQMMWSYLMRMMMTKMTPTLTMELLHQLR